MVVSSIPGRKNKTKISCLHLYLENSCADFAHILLTFHPASVYNTSFLNPSFPLMNVPFPGLSNPGLIYIIDPGSDQRQEEPKGAHTISMAHNKILFFQLTGLHLDSSSQ